MIDLTIDSVIIFVNDCIYTGGIIKTDDEVADDGHVVGSDFVVNHFVANLLHSTYFVVADDVVYNINAIAPGGRFEVGEEGEAIRLQILGEYATCAFHFSVCSVVIEVASDNEGFPFLYPSLCLSLDDGAAATSCACGETHVEACEDKVVESNLITQEAAPSPGRWEL